MSLFTHCPGVTLDCQSSSISLLPGWLPAPLMITRSAQDVQRNSCVFNGSTTGRDNRVMHGCGSQSKLGGEDCFLQLLAAFYPKKCVSACDVRVCARHFSNACFFQRCRLCRRKTRLPGVYRLVLPSLSLSFFLYLFLSPPSYLSYFLSYWHKHIHVNIDILTVRA